MMRNIIILSILFTIIALFAISNLAFAQTFNVSSTQELRQALQDAASNGQSDVIQLADGTYKTTDDGGGTFTFLDNEDYDLTIQGSAAEKVIFSGEDTNQVLSLYGAKKVDLFNISIINGKTNGDGGGVYTNAILDMNNCIISNNTAYSGGGFHTASNATASISSSIISGNTAAIGGGGTTFAKLILIDSVLSGNTGGALFSVGQASITNCIIYNNFGYYLIKVNNYDITIKNSIITDNEGIIDLKRGTGHHIFNSIINTNETYSLNGASGVIAKISNCYIDESKINVISFKNDNVFGANLDFIDPANGDFHIGENSVLIDAGTTDVSDVTFPEFDMDGNIRVSGGAIDIGPYEYSTTAPTINIFTYSGTAEIYSPITFMVSATSAEGRAISQYEMDFGDGVYATVEASTTHTYSTGGDYTVRVKITDNTGEFSETSLSISISGPPADILFVQDITQATIENDPEAAKTAFYELLYSGLSTDEIVEALYNGTASATDAGCTQDFVPQDVDDAYDDGYQAGINEGSSGEDPPYTGELAENIQTYLILTDSSKPFSLPAGSYIQAYGSSGSNTINIKKYARVAFQNFIGPNVINIKEASTEFTVYRSGATIYFNSSSGTLIKIPATLTPQTLRFADGSSDLFISGDSVSLGDQVIDETETMVEAPLDGSDTSLENIF